MLDYLALISGICCAGIVGELFVRGILGLAGRNRLTSCATKICPSWGPLQWWYQISCNARKAHLDRQAGFCVQQIVINKTPKIFGSRLQF